MSTLAHVPVRTATTSDRTAVCATLTEAFTTDPVMSWCFPDDEVRPGYLVSGFEVLFDATVGLDGVISTEADRAAMIWVPQGQELDGEHVGAEFGRTSGPYAERVLTLLALLDEHHPDDRPHDYLFVLGTLNAWQSRGLGSALLRSVLEPGDRSGTPTYLEATSPRNRALYERHGFGVVEEVRLPDGPPLWCMWREPRDQA